MRGAQGGDTLCIKDGRLHYDYNALQHEPLQPDVTPLPKGKVDVKFTFTKEVDGTAELD